MRWSSKQRTVSLSKVFADECYTETGLQFFNSSLSRVSDFISGFTIAVLKVIEKSPCLKLLFTIATNLHVVDKFDINEAHSRT